MAAKNLADIDLNLLLALQVLLEEKHVTRAAVRLRTSQPAVSRALARLREVFDDPLLVRSGAGLQLTERAKTLLPRVEVLLRSVEELTREEHFDPASAKGVFRLAAPDVVSLMLVPSLLQRFAKIAPGIELEIVQWRPEWRAHLESGEIALTVGFPKGDEPGIYARPLLEQDWAVVLRKGHPALRKKWNQALYASLEHMLVTLPGPGPGPVDEALAALDLRRHVALRLPYPMLAPMLVAGSELVVTTVRWLAEYLAQREPVVVLRPPISLPRARVPMLWHERSHEDPRHRWFREEVARAAASIDRSMLLW